MDDDYMDDYITYLAEEERREKAKNRLYGATLRDHKLAILTASRLTEGRAAMVLVDLTQSPITVEALSLDDLAQRVEADDTWTGIIRDLAKESGRIRVLVLAHEWYRATWFTSADQIDTAADQADPHEYVEVTA